MSLRNSTDQIDKKFSNKLKEVSLGDDVKYNPIKQDNFIKWESRHNYRTTYSDMDYPYPKLVNVHYIPKYDGYVPRVVSENMFGSNFTKLGNTAIRKFDEIRYSGKDSDNYKE